MVRARRHPVPDLVEVPLQVLFECRERHAIDARRTAVRLHPLVGFPDELLGNVVRLCLGHRLIPSMVAHFWLTGTFGWRVGSLRSARVTRLHRSYEPIRPCTPHRYSAPHGSATWRSPFASGRQVPTFHTRAVHWPHAVFMPVAARTVGRHPPSFIPGQRLEPGFGDIPTLSTGHRRFTCVRLASAHLTGSMSRLLPQRSPPRPLGQRSLRWFEP